MIKIKLILNVNFEFKWLQLYCFLQKKNRKFFFHFNLGLWTEDSSYLIDNDDTFDSRPRTYSEDSEFTVLSPTRGEFLLNENTEIENYNSVSRGKNDNNVFYWFSTNLPF